MIRDHEFAMRATPYSDLLWMLYIAKIETVLTEKKLTSSIKANPVIFKSPFFRCGESKDAKESNLLCTR